MKRIILLRFHKDLPVVQNRIDILKHFNPTMPIYGLFGGSADEFENFKNNLRGLDSIYFLDIPETDIKWRFSDWSILQWFKDIGKTISFDVVHTIEYDLLILDKLENVYPYADGEEHVYITSLIELEKIKPFWNWFQLPETFVVEEEKAFEQLLKEKYKLTNLYASLGPGTTLTRKFLEGYTKLDLPLIAHDEVRTPAIAQILNIPMKDTGFVPDWFDETGPEFRLFNCEDHEVPMEEFLASFRSGKRKAFHPIYDVLPLNVLSE